MPKVQINYPMRTGRVAMLEHVEGEDKPEPQPQLLELADDDAAHLVDAPVALLGEVPNTRRGTAGTNEQTISVSWLNSRDGTGWVQLALEGDIDYFKFVQDFPDADSTSERTTAYTPVLDRQEINRLIKALRRARDAAYGRDE